ncbi:CPBP family intramembrane glutamic endopeptidase [Clostridium estertheticum]|uniref:CPBP family intramembrane metalloprotease n=1 Tax=Clostridium estertheticum TaxID=238834 RepID=A0A5N7IM70_9CLOT|nr:type II CAAX endopeptidase family protein [Clostridium estertheticum]MBU3187392.1 CPBP family intramembrane metalloprotease [Clostridium estertheticum]MBX4261220.1 CPBP family intramembrane metalloprotease [Clostridium estertheticum]MPQ31336.1 CPBP family intramembrane metalloprotease [Clostridium estertheticum]MPQ62010.1 CPBP family intramembrane metalloprotease [Clostridium estertheticum]WLC71740.1 CPBP family intramembrane metalloprotease [Clostridium estertheticum]
MDNLFEKIKVKKVLLFYILAIILTFLLLQIPVINNIYLKDKYVAEIMLSIILLVFVGLMVFRGNNTMKTDLVSCIKRISYKKIARLYILNIGLYIGVGLILLVGTHATAKGPTLIYLISGVTTAPIIEELFFRGLLLNKLKFKTGIRFAILISATIFAILHFDLNFIGRFFMGVLSALLYIETKNIVNCIIFHMLCNFSIFLFVVLSQYVHIPMSNSDGTPQPLIIVVFYSSIVISIVMNIKYIKNNLPRKRSISL